jgi:hypothetical protein
VLELELEPEVRVSLFPARMWRVTLQNRLRCPRRARQQRCERWGCTS